LWAGCPIRFEHRWDAFGNGAHESQRAWVAAKIENMRQGERTDLEPSANLHKVDRKAAATMLNVSERSVASAAVVRDKATPEPQAAVEQDHSAARSPPGRHQMALRLGDACLRGSFGGSTVHRRERLYGQSVETISGHICKRASRRDSVFPGCDTCPRCRGAWDGRQNDRGRDNLAIEKVAAVSPAGEARAD
jgi:hypothetical protein